MKALRACLCVLVIFAVLAFGSNDVWSESLLEIVASLLFLWWAVLWYRRDTSIEWNPLNWPLLGFVVIASLQILFHRTAYGFLTRLELLKLAAYFFFFFVVAQAFRDREDLSKLAWFLVSFCFAVSMLAIAQYFTASGTIYWLPRYRLNTTPFGPYPNRGDFAGFVELTLPVGLSLLAFGGVSKQLFPLMAVLTIVPIGAIALSGSRGGIISFAFQIILLTALAVRYGRLRFKQTTAVAAGLVALFAIATVAWLGIGATRARFEQISSHDVSIARRLSLARGAMRIFWDHAATGSGLGTFVTVYPGYETSYDGRVAEHAHNDYLEALAETGILGGACGAVFLWSFFRNAAANFRAEHLRVAQAIRAGGIVAVCGILLHSFVEFNLHIPANALLFLLQVHLATSISAPTASRIGMGK